jgi:single-strand DNA-binding protein
MRSVNKVILIGNLTRDPQLKTTTGGQTVATFGLATNRNWTTNEGEQKSSTEFHELVVWSKLAEIAANTLKTGKLIYVEGYLKTRSWDQEDGTKRFKTEVVVEDLVILSKKEGGSDEYTPNTQQDSAEDLVNDDNLF